MKTTVLAIQCNGCPDAQVVAERGDRLRDVEIRATGAGWRFTRGRLGRRLDDHVAPAHYCPACAAGDEPDREPSAEQERAWDLADDDRRGHAVDDTKGHPE